MNSKGIAYRPTITFTTLLFLILTGCQSLYEKSPLMTKLEAKTQGSIRMSAEELSMRTVELSDFYARTIEGAADDIIRRSSDPDIRRQALLWKLNTIPAVYRSAFYTDPLVAFFDLWIFSMQMDNYFGEGPGKELFGEWRVVAQNASRTLEARTMDLALLIGTEQGASNAREFVTKWAADHPVKSSRYIRESVIPTAVDMAAGQRMGGLSTVGQIAYNIEDITQHIATLNTHLPKQLRWELQLLVQDLLDKEELIDLLQRERAVILQDIDDQRISTLAWFGDERVALTAEAERLIDHLFLRAAQLAVGLLFIMLAAGIVSIRVMRKKSTGK